ncbi:phospholipase A2 inhibitor gamma subunit B-like [Thunnus maccoyii]|uniref:phospholipase A2 inhibitor gamma subunit B-like n=1 Tax=Thunnus maccoyii TaxID=8240 RepID=UPI001C4C3347|nr:phospholipase A2 inhibitor gamma subunit B-like [Thunnus maccoyii]
MMKLILTLTLIWTLSSTAEALECWTGQGTDMKQQTLRNSTGLCATVAFQEKKIGYFSQDTTRLCLPSSVISEGKHTYSFNVGFESKAASVHVCNTDRCNSQVIPHPGIQKKNNLQCFTCNYLFSAVCNETVQCVGTEDRCISWTGGYAYNRDQTAYAFGCASANLCDIASRLELLPHWPFKSLSEPKCCGSSFCNSASSVKLNVIPLLFGLITLIVS